jgi:hypothetical protein
MWIGIGVGAAVLVLIAGVCLGPVLGVLTASKRSDDNRATSAPDRTTGATDTGDRPPALPPQTTPASAGKVGQPVRTENLEFTITAKPNCGQKTYESYMNRKGQLCIVPLTVVNRGSAGVEWFTSDAQLYVNDRDYITASISCEKATSIEGFRTVAPGQTWTTIGCYDLASSLTPVRMRISETTGSDEVWVDL